LQETRDHQALVLPDNGRRALIREVGDELWGEVSKAAPPRRSPALPRVAEERSQFILVSDAVLSKERSQVGRRDTHCAHLDPHQLRQRPLQRPGDLQLRKLGLLASPLQPDPKAPAVNLWIDVKSITSSNTIITFGHIKRLSCICADS